MLVTSDHLNYLQRIGLNNDPAQLFGNAKCAGPDLRQLIKINGYGQYGKDSFIRSLGLPTKDILAGLYGNKIPLAFFITGSPASMDFFLGTWSTGNKNSINAEFEKKQLDQKISIIHSLLESGYPDISIENDIEPVNFARFSQAGLVMGVPTLKLPANREELLPVERLIRTMTGSYWGCLVLAQPVNQNKSNELRLAAIDEMKRVAGSTQNDSPLAGYYIDALQNTVNSLTLALINGNWRTAVYLLGDEISYSRLASAWIGIFSGEQSYPDSISVLQSNEILELANNWKLPDALEEIGPGKYQHPLKYQTLLNSDQLSAYIHFPQKETKGFSIKISPNFDAIPPKTSTSKTIDIGEIILRSKLIGDRYMIDLNKLNRHSFVSGITGSGKTNTIFQLLTQSFAFDIPFLVIEPAKTEYRALLSDDKLNPRLQIFTPGNEMVSPFRLNPFEIVSWPKTPVSVHIDLLRSVFTASFGMWEPLPQILEQCLFAIYKDKGWDITTNTNSRLDKGSDINQAFPTISDLVEKVDEVIARSGYDEKIRDDMRSALHTRLNSLRIGGKGRMLDTQSSLPMDMILKHPTVLELEGMGDDDDKAFIMGLLFIRLVEYRRSQGQTKNLQHLLVIEEAHRLLANVESHASAEEANPRGKAVEAFSNLLSEIRTYGQGVIVADQVPVKLAPDVIKNTNLKITHRCVSTDDRTILAGSTAMNEIQSISVATFKVGEAAVFSEGDDCPILVKINEAPFRDWPSDAKLKEHMARSNELKKYFLTCDPLSQFIGEVNDQNILNFSRDVAEHPLFQEKISSMVLSIIEDDNSLDIFWENIQNYLRQFLKEDVDFIQLQKTILFFAIKFYTDNKGRLSGWTYLDVSELNDALRSLLFSKLAGSEIGKPLAFFRKCFFRLHKRSFDPFVGCQKICDQKTPACIYRTAVADFISKAESDLSGELDEAYLADNENGNSLVQTLAICDKATKAIVNSPVGESVPSRRIALCFAQQILKDRKLLTQQTIINGLVNAIDSQIKK